MIKKLITFAMTLLLTAGIATQAQEGNNSHYVAQTKDGAKSISFPASNIQFWTGTGSNEAVIIVGWDDNPNGNFALAWGVRWNGSATAQNMLDTIMAYDSRFGYSISGSFVTGIWYNDGTLASGSSLSYWCYNVNNSMAGTYNTQPMANGDVLEVSSSCNFTLTSAVAATDPNATETPEDATIAPEDIVYWVGEGSNELVFVVNWADQALAWGYRFAADSVLLSTVMDDIMAADPRFSYSGTGFVSDINFVTDGGDTLGITPGNWWSHLLNGYMSMGLSQVMRDGDFSRWADPAAGVLVDSTYDTAWGGYWSYTYVYPQTIVPVSEPTYMDATIDAEDIVYWVGEGNNELVFVVNWADQALAWGYRFAADSVLLSTVMDDIAAADPRFSYSGTGFVSDISFVTDGGDTLGITPGNWWSHLLNGYMSMGMSQVMRDGDFSRWADPAAGVLVDSTYDTAWGGYWSYTYVYPQTIVPVSAPETQELFCGAVGTEGCTAVKYDDSRIIGWATGCTLVRGSQNLSDTNAPLVTYGTEADAIGPASANTMDVVSLGDGGSATLTFANPIHNVEGYDFAVFENSFNDSFLELAVVEVSSDGEHFVRFAATSLTQTETQIGGSGSVDPRYINNLAGKYRVGYGTPFDLEELRGSENLDIDNITHVRVIDVVGSIDPALGTYDAYGHLINDPFPTISYSAGFDLDGVAVLSGTAGVEDVARGEMRVYPNPADGQVYVTFAGNGSEVAVYDMTGRVVLTARVEGEHAVLNTAALADGVYMLRVAGTVQKLVVRH